jgi:acyl-CoA thioester hydrolase
MIDRNGRFLWPVRVYYEDTDAGGVVYYANYLKFMERARSEWLRSLGFELDRLAATDGVLFAIRDVAVSYRRPARLNAQLLVSASLTEHSGASLIFEQQVLAVEPPGTLLCSGRVRVVCVDVETFRPRAIPEHLMAAIEG